MCAAQRLLAEGRTDVSILDIAELADVGASSLRHAQPGSDDATYADQVVHITGPSLAHVADGVEQAAAERGRLSPVCAPHDDTVREDDLVQLMREQHAAAVLLVGGVVPDEAYDRRVAGYAKALDAAGSRLVLVGRPAPAPAVPRRGGRNQQRRAAAGRLPGRPAPMAPTTSRSWTRPGRTPAPRAMSAPATRCAPGRGSPRCSPRGVSGRGRPWGSTPPPCTSSSRR